MCLLAHANNTKHIDYRQYLPLYLADTPLSPTLSMELVYTVRVWHGHSRDWQSLTQAKARQRQRQTTKLDTKDLRRLLSSLRAREKKRERARKRS
jgi:CRISPR/Cas system type I-B associated protein Csh2 (Cas7 group RAMP superfamily)